MHSLYKIKGVVQHYNWGGTDFIPALIGTENNEQKPFAEYWLGAHPKAPSILFNGDKLSFTNAIEAAPEEVLGSRVKNQFGTLPYLFKILDVRQMLSIQVHPSIESAIKGYANENEKRIPLSAPNRNYKDQNHKPELMAALSDFWLLHGFKNEQALGEIFHRIPALSFLQHVFSEDGYKGLYEAVMTMPQEKVNAVLAPLLEPLVAKYNAGSLDKSDEHFWAVRAVQTFCKDGDYCDRGIFSIYLFNLLHLKKGEGIYQPAGLPHAYLEGQNVEVMANSDNVLRAGLTDKHIDVAELMKHVKFAPTVPAIIPASSENVQVYKTEAAEFELTKYAVTSQQEIGVESAAIFFAYEGEAVLECGEETVDLKRGEAALVLAGKRVLLAPKTNSAMVYAVATPV